jgi:aminoglycoside phosphotransferase (APT) family kinase protein
LNQFDSCKITAWLTETTKAISTKIISIQKLSGGALNENWLFSLKFNGGRLDGDKELVVRTDAINRLPQSLSIQQQYEILQVVHAKNILVPKVFLLAPNGVVSAGQAIFMELMRGTTEPLFVCQKETIKNSRSQMVKMLGQQLGQLHNITPAAVNLRFLTVPKLPLILAKLRAFQNQLKSLPFPLPLLEWSIRWLMKNAPAEHSLSLSHGDFRSGNLMFNQNSLTGILDWEFASWSDPLEDIGWLCARCWRYGNDSNRVGGIGGLKDFITGYQSMAQSIPDWSALAYWEILASVKWAIIAHQQGLRHSKNSQKHLELMLTGHKADEIEYDILIQIKSFGAKKND